MLNWLKSFWAKWNVHVTVVGGALVVATAYGTCTVEPDIGSNEAEVEDVTEEAEAAATINEAVETTTAETTTSTAVESATDNEAD